MTTKKNFKLAAKSPKVSLVNNWSARTQLEEGSILISIVSPGKTSSSTYKEFNRTKFIYHFEDMTPEELTGKELRHLSDEDIERCNLSLATYEEVDDILTTISYYIQRDYKKGSLLIESEGSGRASCFAIAAEFMRTNNYRMAISNIAKEHKDIKPNMWICGLIDYIMKCGGQFTSVVEEMLATGIVVSPYGEVFEMDWKLDV